MKKYLISLFIILSAILISPVDVWATDNSGFIPGQIWYSKETLIEGETVNIHTAVWNGEKNSVSIKVEFYDKNIILGSRDVVLAPLELKDVYISWKITAGDHIISAKIVSSVSIISGKQEKIVLDRIATSNDKQFVSVTVKNNQGVLIGKTGSEISDIIPENIKTSVTENFNLVDDFRNETLSKVILAKEEAQKEVNLIKSDNKTTIQNLAEKSSIEGATKKPIAYIKLFLFSVLSFIFSNKIIFYGLLVLIAFYILRKIYRVIRNK